MAESGTFLDISRTQQAITIGVVGLALVGYGLATSSAVDPAYDPLPFGVGLVMVVYAVGVVASDRLFA